MTLVVGLAGCDENGNFSLASPAGDEGVAVGLVRRRFFRAGGATISRTEVVADVVARADTRTADRALEGLRSALADDTTHPAAGSPSGGSPQSPRAR